VTKPFNKKALATVFQHVRARSVPKKHSTPRIETHYFKRHYGPPPGPSEKEFPERGKMFQQKEAEISFLIDLHFMKTVL
jgi:hypothetical protein